MASISIFANYFINDEERLQRLKDSFNSFKDICATKWIINIRGMFKHEVSEFLRAHLGERVSIHNLESRRGWFNDTRKLLGEIDSDFVLFWIEDHINLAPTSKYVDIIADMQRHNVDVVSYSWFDSLSKHRFRSIPKQSAGTIDFFRWDHEANEIIQRDGGSYIIGACSIFRAAFFRKIVQSNQPYLRRHNPLTPFDFEKRPHDTMWLPFVKGVPCFELFAVIDDDVSGPSLQSRGLYPIRAERAKMIELSHGKTSAWKHILPSPLFLTLRPIAIFFRRIRYSLIYFLS